MSHVIWSNRIGGRFPVTVVHVDSDTGRFSIEDSLAIGEGGLGTLTVEEVPLMYQAAYGPDGADVAAWMKRGIEVVDAALAPPPAG